MAFGFKIMMTKNRPFQVLLYQNEKKGWLKIEKSGLGNTGFNFVH